VRGEDFQLDRAPAAADLASLVERHWLVSWDLPAGRRAAVTLLPHPCVNLVFDRGQLVVSGVGRERFTYQLAGRGQVFGVKFRPGAFLPLLGGPVSQLTGHVRPLAALWGAADAGRFAADLGGRVDLNPGDDLNPGTDADAVSGDVVSGDVATLAAIAERHLRAHWPAPDPEVARVGRIVQALLNDRSISRVDDVSGRFGLSARSLQRLFDRYVGVSPKWVLQRYRLHEAAARLAQGTRGTWTEVAVELGYFDQSHFIRDFTRAVGMTPVGFAEACARRQEPVSA
jgi:AraC-like DNA-binding protein